MTEQEQIQKLQDKVAFLLDQIKNQKQEIKELRARLEEKSEQG